MNDPRDDELSHIYKEGAWPEPSRQIDQAILSASRRAARARHPIVWRWAPPLALAATVVLTSTLVLKVYEEQPEERIASPGNASVREAAKAASPAAEESKPAVPPQSPPSPAPEASTFALKKETAAPARADQVQSRIEPRAREPVPSRERQPETLVQPMSAPARAVESPVTAPAQTAPAPAAGVISSGAVGEAAAGGIVIRRSDSPERAPQTWLDDIRKLKAQGRTEEAERELAEFRKRFPDYRLPDDLR